MWRWRRIVARRRPKRRFSGSASGPPTGRRGGRSSPCGRDFRGCGSTCGRITRGREVVVIDVVPIAAPESWEDAPRRPPAECGAGADSGRVRGAARLVARDGARPADRPGHAVHRRARRRLRRGAGCCAGGAISPRRPVALGRVAGHDGNPRPAALAPAVAARCPGSPGRAGRGRSDAAAVARARCDPRGGPRGWSSRLQLGRDVFARGAGAEPAASRGRTTAITDLFRACLVALRGAGSRPTPTSSSSSSCGGYRTRWRGSPGCWRCGRKVGRLRAFCRRSTRWDLTRSCAAGRRWRAPFSLGSNSRRDGTLALQQDQPWLDIELRPV